MSSTHDDDPGGFLSRWSRRKVQLRQGEVPDEPALPLTQPVAQPAAAMAPGAGVLRPLPSAAAMPPSTASGTKTSAEAPAPAPALELPPPPTLADVAALGRDSDFSRFVAPGVQGDVRNAALQKLFSDPRFNIMDGLDTYIDDYGKPDPLPASWLRKLVQSKSLGLFDEEEAAAKAAAAAAASTPSATATAAMPTDAQAARAEPPDPPFFQDANTHENADLRLQPHDAAGPASPGAGPEPDAGRQR